MGAGEGKRLQFVKAKPAYRTFGGRAITVCDAPENVKSDAVAGDGVFDCACRFKGHRKEAEGGFGDFVDVGFAVNFDVWEFPKVSVDDAGWSLANEVAGVSVDDEGEEASRSSGSTARDVRE